MRSRKLLVLTTVTVPLVAHVHHRSASASSSSSQWHLLGYGARAGSERYRGRCRGNLQLFLVLSFATTTRLVVVLLLLLMMIRRYDSLSFLLVFGLL